MLSDDPGRTRPARCARARRSQPHEVLVRGALQPHEGPWKWFEGPIYKFINKNNEQSMQRASAWLTDHPEYRPDLIETSDAGASA